jgi:hypothetical protein
LISSSPHSKDHQKLDWSKHKLVCHEPNSPSLQQQSIHLKTPEGYQLQLCHLHHKEICSLCTSNYSASNAIKRYDQLLLLSQKVLEQEQILKNHTVCSNSNCQSRWEATEEFIPPVITPSSLQTVCHSCHHAVYCSQSCRQEHQSEHQMLCKLYTPLYRDQREGTCHQSYCLGTVLEEIVVCDELTIETGLRMKVIFFNGDIDPSSSLSQISYYLCEYMSPSSTEEPLLIPAEDVDQSEETVVTSSSNLSWRRLAPTLPNLERCLNGKPTGTFVQIINTTEESGKTIYAAMPWVRARHLSPPASEIKEGRCPGLYVVLECHVAHEGKRWRRR